jgi:hypothetical protein
VIKSDNIEKFSEALAKAQAEFGIAIEDSVNPHFKSKFASYKAIHDACVPVLNRHGFSVMHLPGGEGNTLILLTLLAHSSGQYVGSEFRSSLKDTGPQAMGSAISYGKRYNLAALTGLRIAEEDDDGEVAESRNAPKPVAKPPPPAKVEAPKPDAAAAIRAAAAKPVAAKPTLEDVKARKAALLAGFWKDYGPDAMGQVAAQFENVLGRKLQWDTKKKPTCPEDMDAWVKFSNVGELERLEKYLSELAVETEGFFEQAAAIQQEAQRAKESK